jgi:hypothetical protein
VYSLPGGSSATTNTTIESAPYNALIADIETALNSLPASAVTLTGVQTLTNKTLTAPALNAATVGTSFVPTTTDAAALGSTLKMFSDLFLALGAVINFNNGDATITHAAGVLTINVPWAMADQELRRPVLLDYGEKVNAIGGTGGGTQDINLELGNVVTATVDTSANTFTFSNPSASGTACSFTLILTNGGSQTVNWPASVDWASGVAPTLTAAGRDVLSFLTVDGGTIWYGFVGGKAFA